MGKELDRGGNERGDHARKDDSHLLFTFRYLFARKKEAGRPRNLHVGEISQPDRSDLFLLYQVVPSGDCPTGLETGINKKSDILYFGSLYKMLMINNMVDIRIKSLKMRVLMSYSRRSGRLLPSMKYSWIVRKPRPC